MTAICSFWQNIRKGYLYINIYTILAKIRITYKFQSIGIYLSIEIDMTLFIGEISLGILYVKCLQEYHENYTCLRLMIKNYNKARCMKPRNFPNMLTHTYNVINWVYYYIVLFLHPMQLKESFDKNIDLTYLCLESYVLGRFNL